MTACDTIVGDHPSDWGQTPLKSICEISVGPSRLKKVTGIEDGVPVVSSAQIIGGRIILDGARWIDHEDAKRHATHRLRPHDLVMTRRCIEPRHALATREHAGAMVDGSCFRLRVPEPVLAEYLQRYLAHPGVQEWLKNRIQPGLIPNLRTIVLGALPVLIPPLPEQREMVRLFRVLDEKITTHEQIIDTARQLRNHLIGPLLATGLGPVDCFPTRE